MSEAIKRCRCGRSVIQRENWWPSGYGPRGCPKCLKSPHLCDCPPFLEPQGYIDPLGMRDAGPSYEHIMPPSGLCDFCLRHEITKEYPAQRLMGVDIGAWAACSCCAPLIDAGDWDGLLRRVVQESPLEAAAVGAHISLKVFRSTKR